MSFRPEHFLHFVSGRMTGRVHHHPHPHRRGAAKPMTRRARPGKLARSRRPPVSGAATAPSLTTGSVLLELAKPGGRRDIWLGRWLVQSVRPGSCPPRSHRRSLLHPRRSRPGTEARHRPEQRIDNGQWLIHLGHQRHRPGYAGDRGVERPRPVPDRQQLPGSRRRERHARRGDAGYQRPGAVGSRVPAESRHETSSLARRLVDGQEPVRVRTRRCWRGQSVRPTGPEPSQFSERADRPWSRGSAAWRRSRSDLRYKHHPPRGGGVQPPRARRCGPSALYSACESPQPHLCRLPSRLGGHGAHADRRGRDIWSSTTGRADRDISPAYVAHAKRLVTPTVRVPRQHHASQRERVDRTRLAIGTIPAKYFPGARPSPKRPRGGVAARYPADNSFPSLDWLSRSSRAPRRRLRLVRPARAPVTSDIVAVWAHGFGTLWCRRSDWRSRLRSDSEERSRESRIEVPTPTSLIGLSQRATPATF